MLLINLKSLLEAFNISNLKVKKLKFKDLLLIKSNINIDNRGFFVKPYSNFKKNLHLEVDEIYYSISKKNVLRGIHFQKPPFHCTKLIYVIKGSVLDVLVDLRLNSPTFKQVISLVLSENENALLIPPGIGHGFLSLKNGTIMVYNQSKVYNKKYDDGVLWSSINFDWNIQKPILSDRDKNFQSIDQLQNTFNF